MQKPESKRAPMCIWCEKGVCDPCKSRYDTLTCTHRVIVPTAEEWDSAIEARAAELHEGCRMPMEQARELAASEASPDWYARGQDWGLADALTNGQSGDWVLDDIARAFAAGAQAADQSSRTADLVAVLARLCKLNVAERPMAKVWNAAQALVDSYKGADTRKPCTCDGAGRGPGRACVVKAGGRLGALWRCVGGLES